jgi:chemotaxis protein MotB
MSKKMIIIIKKARAHGGHHGGAWKVAYADFVTAMMALFIVLWLMNTSDHVRKLIAGYFNDPRGRASLTGTDQAGSDDKQPLTRENVQQLKERLEKAILQTDQFKALSNQIEMKITPEGLRIELLESKNGTFFDTGGTALNANGRELLTVLAQQLSRVPNSISIEGHTDSLPYANDAGYGNWELSADRANAARRLMQEKGLRHDQVSQVRGYADQRLRLPKNPLDPSNRRISLIVQNLDGPTASSAVSSPSWSGDPAKQLTHPAAVAAPRAATKPAAAVSGKAAPARENPAAGLLARLYSH